MTRFANRLYSAAAKAGRPVRRTAALLRRRRATRLLIAPQDIRVDDPVVASDFANGSFPLVDKRIDTAGGSPFLVNPPSEAWSAALHGFEWLRHFRSASKVERAAAAELVRIWMLEARAMDVGARTAFRPDVVARRVISWLSHSPLVLESAEPAAYETFLRAVERDAVALEDVLAEKHDGFLRLQASIALQYAGLALDNSEGRLEFASRRAGRELKRWISPVGDALDRNPATAIALLLDLLPLRQAFKARGLEPPAILVDSVPRLLAGVRRLRHFNGDVALFNGMGETPTGDLAAIFAHAGRSDETWLDDSEPGYARLEGGATTVLADFGPMPTFEFALEPFEGCLSFEFSDGAERVIVNCGAPPAGVAFVEALRTARTTFAHSAPYLDAGVAAYGRTRRIKVERRSAEGEESGSHDGFAAASGYAVRRALSLSADGRALRGLDSLELKRKLVRPNMGICANFHLHASVKAELQAAGSVTLTLPSGAAWLFFADSGRVTLEASDFFASSVGPRKTSRINLAVEGHEAHWALTKIV